MTISSSDWVLGITMSVLGSLIGGGSKLAIRKSFLMEQDVRSLAILPTATDATTLSHDNVGPPKIDLTTTTTRVIRTKQRLAILTRVIAWLGMTTLNPLCSVLAMSLASPSIVVPFSGLSLVWIVVFSDTLLGEKPSNSQVRAASLIVLGEAIVAFYGDHTNDEGKTIDSVLHSYHNPAFVAFLICIALWMMQVTFWICREGTSSFTRRFAWGVAGGSVTGLQNFLKDSLTIIKRSSDQGGGSSDDDGGNSDIAIHWSFLVFFGLAMSIALGGLLLLTLCMKRNDVVYSSAMFVGSFVISASIMSAIHYDTFSNLSEPIDYVMYPGGLLILMTGVWILVYETRGDAPQNHEDSLTNKPSIDWSTASGRIVDQFVVNLSRVIREICHDSSPELDHLQPDVSNATSYGGV